MLTREAMAIRHGHAIVVAILLALATFNAVEMCKAVAPVQHSCCPASRQQAPEQCPKLGCFMAAPMLRPNVESLRPLAAVACPPVAPVACRSTVVLAPSAEAPDSVFDRSVSFHQLLI